VRKILHGVMRFLFAILTRVNAQGLENIPRQGAAILAANHQGIVDAAMLFALLKRTDATGLVADKYQKNAFMRWLINSVHGIWINRESADLGALREALDYLRQGGMLGIAPEGTRSHSGVLMQAKTGVAYLADKSGVPIVPIAIWGSQGALAKAFRLTRPRLYVRVGKPFTLPAVDRKDREAGLQRNTDEIMCRIAAMLPDEYWGAYADHPRLQELVAGNAV
jgi:1-acyl-sn-glycerol-3-phosphate acyltransferase